MKKMNAYIGIVASFFVAALSSTTAFAVQNSYTDNATDDLPFFVYIVFFIIGILIITAGIFAYFRTKHKEINTTKKEDNKVSSELITFPVSDIIPVNYTEMINAEIRKHDPDFSGAVFCDWSKNVFIRILRSITDRNISKIRILLTREMFSNIKKEINDLASEGQYRVYKNIMINRSYLNLYVQNGNKEFITVYFSGKMQTYPEESLKAEPLPGYYTQLQDFKYLVTFCRNMGSKTTITNGIQAMICKTCGAPLADISDINCSYCGSSLESSEKDWIISDIKVLSKNCFADNRGIVIMNMENYDG